MPWVGKKRNWKRPQRQLEGRDPFLCVIGIGSSDGKLTRNIDDDLYGPLSAPTEESKKKTGKKAAKRPGNTDE